MIVDANGLQLPKLFSRKFIVKAMSAQPNTEVIVLKNNNLLWGNDYGSIFVE